MSNAHPSTGCVCFHLRRAARAVTQAYEQALAPVGLLPTQFSLLSVLRKAGPMPVSTAAKLMGMDRTTLTRNLKPLEREGLTKVAAGSGADGRVRLVRITEKGDRTWQRAQPLWEVAHKRMLDGLGDQGWSTLRDHLTGAIAVAGERAATT
jgi:DNA-binding MarR family transcriptional regulator